MAEYNLIPKQRKQNKQRRQRLRRWIVFTASYLVLLSFYLIGVHVLLIADDEQVTSDLHEASQHIEHYQASLLRLHKELMNISANRVTQQAIENQPSWGKLLMLVSNPLGEDLVLTHCQLTTLSSEGSAITAPTDEPLSSDTAAALLQDRQYRLNLAGLGQHQNTVSQYVLQLEQSGLFNHVSMLKSERETFLGQSALTFTIECLF